MATPIQPITGEIGVSYPEARITATPGMFCEAMVTTNRGRAIPTTAGQDSVGQVNTGVASCSRSACTCSRPCMAATSTPTSKVAITA
ncbi:hypothetical protein D3C71_1354620 [compost metagenome]